MNQSFVISPRIIAHLWEELIRNESIAMLELVKNSYDVCATTCRVDFQQELFAGIDKIVIEDDGKVCHTCSLWLLLKLGKKRNIQRV